MPRRLAALALVVLVAGAGCTVQVDDYKHVSLAGEVTYNDSGFRAAGDLRLAGNPDAAPYEDLAVLLLAANGSVQRRVPLPAVFDRTAVEVTAEERPTYVVVTGDSLWADDEQTFVDYYVWDAERYRERTVDDPGDFPVDVPD